MSAAGFGIGAALSGFGQAYNAARVRKTQMEVDQRNHLASTLLTLYPNAKPEAQADIAQRILSIYSTPAHKKLDKNLSDISTLGQGGQQGQQGQPGAGPVTSQPAGPGGMPLPPPSSGAAAEVSPGGSLPSPPSVTSGTPPSFGAPSAQAPSSAGPSAPSAPSYSAWLTPQDRAKQASQQAAGVAEGTTSGQLTAHLHAYEQFKQQHPDATPQDFLVATGRGVPYGMVRPVPISRSVTGDDVLKSNPDIVTTGGEQVDPKGTYDLVQIGGQTYAAPSGLGAKLTQANITKAGAQTSELGTREQLEKGRIGLIPYQTAKIIQDLQLNPQKVEIARANAVGRWYGPTNIARDSAQYAADVEDKIDAVQPLIASLAKSGKLSAVQGRWETFLTDKVRAGDPDMANLQNQFDVLGKAVMKMHGFRNAQQANQFIAERLNAATDADQLVGSLEGLRSAARTYESMAQFPPDVQAQMMKALTGGKNVKPKGTERLPAPPTSGASGAPTGAVSIGTSKKDGKDHYLDGNGKDLGPVQ